MSVPEQLFADSFLRLSHEATGIVLDFSALDAVKSWRELGLPPVQVGHAREWTKARQRDIEVHAAITLDYDWYARRHDINICKCKITVQHC